MRTLIMLNDKSTDKPTDKLTDMWKGPTPYEKHSECALNF